MAQLPEEAVRGRVAAMPVPGTLAAESAESLVCVLLGFCQFSWVTPPALFGLA